MPTTSPRTQQNVHSGAASLGEGKIIRDPPLYEAHAPLNKHKNSSNLNKKVKQLHQPINIET